ncbi:hypothetical protein JW998_14590 [candidate division KSB1 bacterium]|nr:hypothetical protein [candidate division KSB1 bacterium]
MKFLKFALLALVVLLFACDEASTIFETLDKTKMSPPLGLTSVTQNGQIALFWYTSNYEKNFGGYYIFQANDDLTNQSADSSLSSAFVKVDSLIINASNASKVVYSDKMQSKVITGLTNGQTYSFAIVAYNRKDEQEISYPSNIIADTPRPDITTVALKSASTNQVTGDDSKAGFDFDTFTVVSVPAAGYVNDNSADLINEAFDPGSGGNIRTWIAGMNGAGLQDLGYMDDLDGADIAPESGYSEEGKSIAVLAGHVYAVRTGDNNFGKIIITNIGGAPDYAITFNAAFQLQTGNNNYKTVPMSYQLGLKQ